MNNNRFLYKLQCGRRETVERERLSGDCNQVVNRGSRERRELNEVQKFSLWKFLCRQLKWISTQFFPRTRSWQIKESATLRVYSPCFLFWLTNLKRYSDNTETFSPWATSETYSKVRFILCFRQELREQCTCLLKLLQARIVKTQKNCSKSPQSCTKTNLKCHAVHCWVLYKNWDTARSPIGRCLWSIKGQTHEWRHRVAWLTRVIKAQVFPAKIFKTPGEKKTKNIQL